MTAELWLIAAVLAQGGLALGLLWVLGQRRLPRVGKGDVKIADIALSDDAWPDEAKQAANAFGNQFQLPVLFYVAAAISVYFGATWIDASLAWAFVLTRAFHAAVHINSNHVPSRFKFYMLGYLILCVLWVRLIARLILSMLGQ